MLLYVGSVLWVIGYDTIYAHQDKEDDAIVGVQLDGAAVRRQHEILAGRALRRRADPVGECLRRGAGADAGAGRAARRRRAYGPPDSVLDIDDPDQCLRLFKSNNLVGWLIFLGLIGGGVWMALKPLI